MEQDYLIATASTCDLTNEYLSEHDIPFIKYSYTIGERVYYDDCSETTRQDVYTQMRSGALLNTAAINTYTYLDFFDGLVKKNKKKISSFLICPWFYQHHINLPKRLLKNSSVHTPM